MPALTMQQGDELLGLLIQRGPWGIVPSDLPRGITLRQVRQHLTTTRAVDVRDIERETADGSTIPALRRYDRADQEHERRAEQPETVIHGGRCIACDTFAVQAGDPCDMCPDGHVVLTAIRLRGRARAVGWPDAEGRRPRARRPHLERVPYGGWFMSTDGHRFRVGDVVEYEVSTKAGSDFYVTAVVVAVSPARVTVEFRHWTDGRVVRRAARAHRVRSLA